MKLNMMKKRTLPLRWVSSPGPFDCRSNALSTVIRRFHTTFLTEYIMPIRHGYIMNYLLTFQNHFSRSLENCITHRDNGTLLYRLYEPVFRINLTSFKT